MREVLETTIRYQQFNAVSNDCLVLITFNKMSNLSPGDAHNTLLAPVYVAWSSYPLNRPPAVEATVLVGIAISKAPAPSLCLQCKLHCQPDWYNDIVLQVSVAL